MVRWSGTPALISLLLVTLGCGSGYSPPTGVTVTGKIVRGGQPVGVAPTPDGYNGVEIQYGPASSTGAKLDSGIAMCDDSGGFTLIGPGEGVHPGKYKLAIAILQNSNDTLEGKLDSEKSTIEIDVPQDKVGGTHDVGTIDLADHLK
jgi:hypothetical protein